jgi:hypothetical protein
MIPQAKPKRPLLSTDGMMEGWNNGIMGNENAKKYSTLS